ncbi:hypothetical protein [Paraburkholderia sp. 40]|uniref:hypothetical protein n=1 Tax=unclassified Paraburkholderia TaxID=2615204 RepID=UPI003D2336E0
MDFQLCGDATAEQENEIRPIQTQPDIQVTQPTPSPRTSAENFPKIGRLSSVIQHIVD